MSTTATDYLDGWRSVNVPTSRQWIAIPTNPQVTSFVDWREGYTRTAQYYTVKCYWGLLQRQKPIDPVLTTSTSGTNPNVPEKTEASVNSGAATTATVLDFTSSRRGGFCATAKEVQVDAVFEKPKYIVGSCLEEILGMTDVFIAAELLESHYRMGPSKEFHLRDLAGYDESTGKPEWITMELNACFHFGQNGSGAKRRRFVVYHPPISRSMQSPRVFQHRFTGMLSEVLGKAVTEDAVKVAPGASKTAVKAGSAVAGQASTIVKSIFGDYLHRFLSDRGVQQARWVYMNRFAQNSALPAWKKITLALQYVEGQLVQYENEQTANSIEDRVMLEVEAQGVLNDNGKRKAKFWEVWDWNVWNRVPGSSTMTDEARTKAIKEFVGKIAAGTGAERSFDLPDDGAIAQTDSRSDNEFDRFVRLYAFGHGVSAPGQPGQPGQPTAARQPDQRRASLPPAGGPASVPTGLPYWEPVRGSFGRPLKGVVGRPRSKAVYVQPKLARPGAVDLGPTPRSLEKGELVERPRSGTADLRPRPGPLEDEELVGLPRSETVDLRPRPKPGAVDLVSQNQI